MGMKSIALLVSLLFSSVAFADCPNCRGREAGTTTQVRVPGPNWVFRGSDLGDHLRSTHGIDPTGMSPAQMGAAHSNAHNAGRSVSRSVIRTAPVRRFRIFRR